ncbi:MAG TPA: TraB/GumN family protein [Steroidobacteraceae bacterium]|nr:TraB/GumN family protein [Steroidobacteraceae bacterium]
MTVTGVMRLDSPARCVRATACLWLAALLAPAPTAAEANSVDRPLEEVLVTGQHPGPGLWKVTRAGDPDGHVLWVLGNYSPLPKKLTWRPTEIETTLRASQQVIAPPSISASVGPLGGITLLPSLIGARNSPNGRRLAEILPGDLYARWLPLKQRYLGSDGGVERWRPIFAANALYQAALAQRGLVPYAGVWPQVEKLARKAGVPVHDPQLEIEVQKPRAAIKDFKRMPLDDVECFARTLQRLETDMDLMRDRANAWAVGDVARLRRLAPVERATACIGVLLESSLVQERGYGDLIDRARLAWLQAVERAHERNVSTLAVISIDELLEPDGHFARLREKGFVVEEP